MYRCAILLVVRMSIAKVEYSFHGIMDCIAARAHRIFVVEISYYSKYLTLTFSLKTFMHIIWFVYKPTSMEFVGVCGFTENFAFTSNYLCWLHTFEL